MKAYMHSYEAYRVPKGTQVKDVSGNDVILSQEKDVLVLTEKASNINLSICVTKREKNIQIPQ